ncbi:hypothetical protein RvY_14278 [Ramazzottius varieornatus]|uniref:Uncharacterized protein n=1 Tax=Ramazzottius varieornatus TaxID=947166 RepID=A0A1D1VY06_RAMVA|nr:hypothetical protein RvY_14278 [Ramazzottius varieornatus]
MVKDKLMRLIGRTTTEAIPYGTQDEEQSLHTVTPVKYRTVLETTITTSTLDTYNFGFVQKVRDSFRRKKKAKEYDLITERPSPFQTPPRFILEKIEPATPIKFDSPFGMENLQQLVIKRKAGQHQLKENFGVKTTHDSQDENVSDVSDLSTGNQEVFAKLAEPLNTDVDEKLIDAYFKTPDGIRKYHRRSKVFLSVKEDHLI